MHSGDVRWETSVKENAKEAQRCSTAVHRKMDAHAMEKAELRSLPGPSIDLSIKVSEQNCRFHK